MGIATDIVIQQRHRQKGESGAEELAAELQEAEENFEDIREALRARLFRPVRRFGAGPARFPAGC